MQLLLTSSSYGVCIQKIVWLVFRFRATWMMYPKWMLRLLFYFDLWGFCTQFRSNQPQFDRFILIFHILLASIVTNFISKYVYRPGNDRLGRVNDICKFTVLLLLQYWLSIFELYFKRQSQRHFWCYVHYIVKHFCSLQRFDLGFYPLKIKIYFTLSIIVNGLFFKHLLTTTHTEFIYFWLCYLFIIWIYQNRSFYYLFYLEWIKHELKRVNHEATYHSNFLKIKNLFTKKISSKSFQVVASILWFNLWFMRCNEYRIWVVKCGDHFCFNSFNCCRF